MAILAYSSIQITETRVELGAVPGHATRSRMT
jgi:hypothetical protein